MNHASIVSVLQRFTNLGNNRQGLLRFGIAGVNKLPQVRAIDEFHEEVVQSAGRLLFIYVSHFAEVEDTNDIRMTKSCECSGFAIEPFSEGWIFCRFGADDF